MKLFKNLRRKTRVATVIAALMIIAIVGGAFGVSWIATCGLVKLITLCFGWTFSWAWATGVWLILCLLSMTVGGNKGGK